MQELVRAIAALLLVPIIVISASGCERKDNPSAGKGPMEQAAEKVDATAGKAGNAMSPTDKKADQ
jgi:hypothetical protein